MATVNYTNFNIDQTVRIYDEFYGFQVDINANDYDAVFSYFRSVYKTDEAAGNFTATIFRIANEQNISALTLLEQIKTNTQGDQVDATIAYYLNSLRSATTLVGIAAPTQPNFYAARNIRS